MTNESERVAGLHVDGRQGTPVEANMHRPADSLVDRPIAVCLAILLWLAIGGAVFALGPWSTLSDGRNGTLVFDLTGSYSHQEAKDSWAAFGIEGRRLYRRHLVLDSLFACLQGCAIGWLLLFALRRAWGASRLQGLALAPLLLTGLDLVENAGIAGMMGSFPEIPTWMSGLTSRVTTWKLALIPILPLAILASLGVLTHAGLRKRRAGPACSSGTRASLPTGVQRSP